MKRVPIFIVTRDRVRALRKLVAWLERAGHERITLVDNASTFEPLTDYLDDTPHRVIRLGQNLGAHAVWNAGLVPDEPYVVTDPDCVPVEDCPHDAVRRLSYVLDRHPTYRKAGLGLYLEDVPPSMPRLGQERILMSRPLGEGVFDSAVDTTFALYKPGLPFMRRAIRTGFPYMARHLCPSWYGTAPDVEDRYYVAHALRDQDGSTWARTTVLA